MSFPARKSYSQSALVLWLDRLAVDWEHHFAPEILETARAIYRKSETRELHVLNNALTARVQWEDGTAAHSVVEWHNGAPLWRSSLESTALGAAIAAAGLYELEELLGDELSGSAGTDNNSADYEQPSPDPGDSAATGTATSSDSTAPIRKLALVLSPAEDGGVLCLPRWAGAGTRPPSPAYDRNAPQGVTLAPEESASLLRFAMRARKCGFAFDAAASGWRMPPGTSSVSRFLREELPAWRELWRVEGAGALETLARELPPLELEAVAENEKTAFAGTLPSFRLRWRLRLGEDWLPDSVASRLLAAPIGTAVFIPGRGLARLGDKQRDALRHWGGGGAGAHAEALPRYALLSLFDDGRLRVAADAELTAWRDALLGEPEPPPGLPGFLRSYQARGVAWLARMLALGTHPLLADEMGLGKTVQVLALLKLAANAVAGTGTATNNTVAPTSPANTSAASALVVCPASVVPVWAAEAARFFPEIPLRVLGSSNDWKHDPAPALWLASYAQLRRRKALLAEVEFSHAVLDEAQFVKNPDSRAAQTVLAIRARHRLALTGTPLENHPRDVWSIFEFLMPGLLGKRTQFDARLETDPDAVARVARQIAPFVLRRAKQTVAPELPPKVSVPLLCPMSESQREIYRRLAEEGLKALDEEAPAAQGMGLLALLTRLRQAACDPGLLPGRENAPPSASGKIAVLMERLEEILANGRKAVVFSQFVKLLDRVESVLVKNFAQVPRFRLTGATSDRAAPVSAFQKLSGAGVMLASLRAGGTGVTLHSAEYVFLLDPWWNPAVEAQAADRVHRIGQRNTTFVYRLIAEDTVESRVEALKEAKAELFKQIVGGIGDMSDWREHFPSLRMLLA